MFARLGEIVSRFWWLVILLWVLALVALRPPAVLTKSLQGIGLHYPGAPKWDDITHDGDFEYLPSDKPSVKGVARLEEAFPGDKSKSQLVLVVAREDDELTPDDLRFSDRLACRFQNAFAAADFFLARRMADDADPASENGAAGVRETAEEKLATAMAAWDEALLLDERYAPAYHNRALLKEHLGQTEEAAEDRAEAQRLDPALADFGDRLAPEGVLWYDEDEVIAPITDIWTRHSKVVGEKLQSEDKQAQLIIIQLANEFMAVNNVFVMEKVRDDLKAMRAEIERDGPAGLVVGVSGSAAVGGDMLTAAAESISSTEMYTVILVVLILLVVYRSPLLVAVPLTTIAISLMMATSIVAALTQLHLVDGFQWWDFKVFKTTKIFIIVIMFGAGTDYCLFLISRYREELNAGFAPAQAIARALTGVGDALAASALTTIFGLGMMFFSDFGKFRNSGPAIALCLAVALLTCLTLAPALLRAMGRFVFWPFGVGPKKGATTGDAGGREDGNGRRESEEGGRLGFIWQYLARQIIARPGLILVAAILLMAPFAYRGTSVKVTYDLLTELDPKVESRRGTDLLKEHFHVGESGPVTVLAFKKDGDFESETGKAVINDLTIALYRMDEVNTVRSIAEPLGDEPRRQTGFNLSKRTLQKHRRTREIFLTQVPDLKGNVARFELILQHDPFSLEAVQDLNRLTETLDALSGDPDPEDEALAELRAELDPESHWQGAEFSYSGTTASIRDLRDVTVSDNRRIKVLVFFAVFAVLLLILRHSVTCLYLMASVLFSFYVTIGITELIFMVAYGDTFHGLDWKVPIFLFVILVAIGEDYNIYLTTRVFEEQKRHGPLEGLRRAIVRTGGIITSCGVIMAGTFISMASGTLRGMVELGFALSLGVILDTFVVRPILVPAFFALVCRYKAAKSRPADDASPGPKRQTAEAGEAKKQTA